MFAGSHTLEMKSGGLCLGRVKSIGCHYHCLVATALLLCFVFNSSHNTINEFGLVKRPVQPLTLCFIRNKRSQSMNMAANNSSRVTLGCS